MRRGLWTVAALAFFLPGCGQQSGTVMYVMEGEAMQPTILAGQELTARKVEPGEYEPARGDIVVLRVPDGWARTRMSLTAGDLTVRRVVAVGGDRVSCCDLKGRVYRNGSGLDERYVAVNSPIDVPPVGCDARRFDEVLVRPGELFVMGDHRRVALDSRCLGAVPASAVVAVVDI